MIRPEMTSPGLMSSGKYTVIFPAGEVRGTVTNPFPGLGWLKDACIKTRIAKKGKVQH
jgi:hypothetical protein